MLIRDVVARFARLALLLAALTSSGAAYAQVALGLSSGWNLLGNSSAAPIDVAATFGDAGKITTVWKWNKAAAKWAFYAPSMTAFVLAGYAQSKGYDVLSSIEPKEGFWVNASTAVALAGPVANAVTLVEGDLQQGWNLVGSADSKTPSQLHQSLGASLNAAGKAMVTAWAWDAPSTTWKFYAPTLEAQGGTALTGYISSKGYLPFSTALTVADGFWLNIGAATTTPAATDFPVNEPFAAALIGKGIPVDIARFFAAAKWTFNCPGDATCAYLQTYPNGATREVSVTATPNQQYTPTAAELANTALVSNPVYNGRFAAIGMEDSTPPIDARVDISYFVPTTSIPLTLATAMQAALLTTSGTLRAAPYQLAADASATGGIAINWTEIGKKGVDASIGGALEKYNMGRTGNLYKLASVASDLATAMKLRLETNAWLAELDELEKCAANPNQLSQTDPTYSAATVARLKSIRAEIMANSSVRLLNIVDEVAEGFVPKDSSTVMAVLSVPMKQGHEYTEQTLKEVSAELMREARNSVTSCTPTCPTNLVAIAVSETQIDISWSGSVGTNVVTGYKIARGGANVNSTAATAWSDTGLTPSRTYCYTVSTYNEFGTSANCPQACATTLGPPVVHGTNPFGGELNVVVKSAITVTFSEAMDATTITTGTLTLSSPDGSVAGTVSYGGLTATFTPSADLAYATTYTALITTGVKDLGGAAMEASYTWSFTTEPAPTTGNLQFTQTGTDASISGSANITWNLLETRSDLNTYYPTGTFTADITRTDCDPVRVTMPMGLTVGTNLDGGRMVVYNSTNTAFPNQYEFTLLSTPWSQTFQCGDPRQPVTYPDYYLQVSVGLCIPSNNYPSFTDATKLAGTNYICALSPGGYVFGNLKASWDFQTFK